jgi:hypothetical protein
VPLLINGHSSSTQVKTLKDCLDKHGRDAATDMVKGFKEEKAKKVKVVAARTVAVAAAPKAPELLASVPEDGDALRQPALRTAAQLASGMRQRTVVEEVAAAIQALRQPALGGTPAFGGPLAFTSLASRVNLLTHIYELHLIRQELTTPLLTTRYSPLTTHYSLLTTHHSPLTTRTQIEEEVMTGANFRDRLVRCHITGDSYTWGLVESVEKTDDAISLKVNRPN